jgi:hypothetical protein
LKTAAWGTSKENENVLSSVENRSGGVDWTELALDYITGGLADTIFYTQKSREN